MKNKAKSTDYVGFIFDHPDLNFSIDHPLVIFKNFKINNLSMLFQSVCQSKKSLKIDNNLKLSIILVKTPVGRGGLEKYYLHNSNCLKIVNNSDNMCAIRAILIAKAYVDNSDFKQDLCKLNSKRLERETIKLANSLDLLNVPCTFREISKIEQFLKYYRICIYSNNKFIYKGPPNQKHIYLLYHHNHYSAISNIKSFLNCSYFCNFCLSPFEKIGEHKCKNICNMCFNPKCLFVTNISCTYCTKMCQNEKCLKIHCEKFCEKLRECCICGRLKSKLHVCNDEKYCLNCQEVVNIDHKCYLLTENEKSKKRKNLKGYIFFDYEAIQENGEHEPNLVCALKLCIECINNKSCLSKKCGRFEFQSNDSFCEWLFSQTNYIAIAHNLKGYDGVFIMNYIIRNLLPIDPRPSVVVNGSKILSIRFKKVSLIDSYSFIPISLASFPNAFGISELRKGFFPHLFNTKSNQLYVGAYPDKKFYGTKFFLKSQLAEFENWYEKVKFDIFDFQKELKAYCWSDVDLLAKGCLKFRKIIMDMTKTNETLPIDPFQNSITIASLCHLIFRSIHLEPKTIGYIPETGYYVEKNHSVKCLVWLDYMSKRDNVFIQHARNGGEKKFGSYHVDGYDPENKTIYEFHGCLFHGCPNCFSPNTYNNFLQSTMQNLYTRHCNRIKYLNSIKGVRLVEIWECQFDRETVSTGLKLQSPLVPRHALFGGRTNALKLHYKIEKNEQIHYVDFTSLYPYVQKYCRFPIGHPEIITSNFINVENYLGLIKCKIIPPRGLYIPVLPCKIKNKLIFSLCFYCASNQCKDICKHSDDERALEGTWVSFEIQKALQLGYKILQLFEVWHWPKSEQYDPVTKTGGLFTQYINLFLKGKQEASGYPSSVTTDDEKNKYIEEFFQHEGIWLDKNQINKNPAQRFVFKLFLNSMWGRLGMNTNRSIYKIISNPAEWFLMLQDKQYIFHKVDFSHPDVIQIYYSNLINEGSRETSVVHAAFVTAHARLRLYSELEKIGDRVLYFDTDSIIYVDRPGEYKPKLGNNLGELTNEIENDFIIEFVSAGPKNYAYSTNKGKSSCTVKGFRIDANSSQVLSYANIRDIVLNNQEKKLETDQLLFKRDKINWGIYCDTIKKQYSFVYDKRVVLDDLTTLPFGF